MATHNDPATSYTIDTGPIEGAISYDPEAGDLPPCVHAPAFRCYGTCPGCSLAWGLQIYG